MNPCGRDRRSRHPERPSVQFHPVILCNFKPAMTRRGIASPTAAGWHRFSNCRRGRRGVAASNKPQAAGYASPAACRMCAGEGGAWSRRLGEGAPESWDRSICVVHYTNSARRPDGQPWSLHGRGPRTGGPPTGSRQLRGFAPVGRCSGYRYLAVGRRLRHDDSVAGGGHGHAGPLGEVPHGGVSIGVAGGRLSPRWRVCPPAAGAAGSSWAGHHHPRAHGWDQAGPVALTRHAARHRGRGPTGARARRRTVRRLHYSIRGGDGAGRSGAGGGGWAARRRAPPGHPGRPGRAVKTNAACQVRALPRTTESDSC